MKKYKTKQREGVAVQYCDNINELREFFPSLIFTKLRSKTTWRGEVFPDLCVADDIRHEDLIIGDWVLEDKDDWRIIPMDEFEEYWEEVTNAR